MTNFIIILISFLLGIGLKHIKKFPIQTSQSINLFIVYVSLPMLILAKFPNLVRHLSLHGNWWMPISMTWISFTLSFIIISLLSKKFKWTKAKTGALILTCGLGNTSFVGFPILEALLGKEAIPIGILADQPGSFLILSTLGILVAAKFGGEATSFQSMFKRLISFPPFFTMLIALVWTIMGCPGEFFLLDAFEKIAATLVPLALFSVGFQTQFKWSVIKKRSIPLFVGISLKLFLFPLFFYLLFVKYLGNSDLIAQVTILEAAMATQITSVVVAGEFNLDTELANLMVGLTIPISIITVPLWNYLFFKS